MLLNALRALFRTQNTGEEYSENNSSRILHSIERPLSTGKDSGLNASMVVTYELGAEEQLQLKEIPKAFKQDRAIQNAIKDVVYLFAAELLGQSDRNKRLTDLQKLYQLYKPQLENKLLYIQQWISDVHAELGNLNKALEYYPRPSIKGRSSTSTDALLSLKHALKLDIEAAEVLSLMGPKLTKWGRDHIESVASYIEIQLNEQKKTRNQTYLSEWIEGTWAGDYQIYKGCIQSSEIKNLKTFMFSSQKKVMSFVEDLSHEAENTAREESGIPKVGEGWLAETELYYKIKNHFKEMEVQHHGRPDWLGRQHLDIYIPSLGVAVEYQGLQHDEPVEYFGGEEGFKKNVSRDKKKLSLCKKNGVFLIYVRSGYVFEMVISEILSKRLSR